MLAVKTSRSLIYRGISTSSTNKFLCNFPIAGKNYATQLRYLDHPNRNKDYHETFRECLVLAPRYADKDQALNELRAKGNGDWHNLTAKEQHKLYHGHFRCALHKYVIADDHWKIYPVIWMWQLVYASVALLFWMTLLQLEHPEYLNDEHWIHEYHKKDLQNNKWPLSGIASQYDYVSGQYRERSLINKLFGFDGNFDWTPPDATDGKQIGFTYLSKK